MSGRERATVRRADRMAWEPGCKVLPFDEVARDVVGQLPATASLDDIRAVVGLVQMAAALPANLAIQKMMEVAM